MITFRWNIAKYKTGPKMAIKTAKRSKKKEFLTLFVHLFASSGRKNVFTVADQGQPTTVSSQIKWEHFLRLSKILLDL